MLRRYHRRENRQSILTGVSFATILLGATATEVLAQTPKDCVALSRGIAATVHEGRYNILCVRPEPGPMDLRCKAEGVPAPSTLRVFPYEVDGAPETTIDLTADGPLPPVTGIAGPDAHVFFSYDGPFDPIRDGYRLTCRW